MHRLGISLAAALLVLAGCGKQHDCKHEALPAVELAAPLG